MADLLATLLSFQPSPPGQRTHRDYDKHACEFVRQLTALAPSSFLRGAETPHDALTVLHPTTNSIAYAFVLAARINSALQKKNMDPLRPGNVLWNRLVYFLEVFDPVQMRYVGMEYRKLVQLVNQIARMMDMPALAISPIRSAMLRLDPTTGTFTSAHVDFIRLCMETRSYAAAVPILDNYIHSLPSNIPIAARQDLEYSVPCADGASSGEFIHTKSGHTEKIALADVQEYYILGAMAYLGVRQFKEAFRMLEHALVVPTAQVGNGLMLEAYKKWAILSCLVNNTSEQNPPRMANTNAIKQIKGAATAYEALCDAFSQFGDLRKLKALMLAGRDVWLEDGNMGLVEALVEHQYRFYVSRLSRTFSAIPLARIASKMGEDADKLTSFVEKLIVEGHLNARLERHDTAGMVLRFHLDPTQGPLAKTEKQQEQALVEQTRKTKQLAEQVRDADYRLGLTKEYVEHVKRQTKKMIAGGGGGAGGDAMDVSWDGEEDIMGDVR